MVVWDHRPYATATYPSHKAKEITDMMVTMNLHIKKYLHFLFIFFYKIFGGMRKPQIYIPFQVILSTGQNCSTEQCR